MQCMNDKFHNYMKKAGEEISLSHEERERMRRTLHAYMEMKPLRAPASPVPLTFGWFFSMRPIAAVLVLGLFISSAGISYAAEGALPGDLLYGIKTHVNEPVAGALAISASAKTAWAMSVAGERIKEAATLAAQGRLSTTTQQDLQTSFQEHAQIATQNIGQQASSSPEASAEIAVRFGAQLSEYENVLIQIGMAKNIDVASLAVAVKTEGDAVAAVRARAESHITSASDQNKAAVRMQIAARTQLDTSAELAHAVSQSLSSSSAQLVSDQLDSARTTISAGEDFTAEHATPDALGAFQSALTATEKLGVFLQTSSDIHARTGLIVGEPQKQTVPKKAQDTDKNNLQNNSETNGEMPSPTSTSVISPSSSSTESSQIAASTTNVEQNTESEANTSIQTQTEEQQKTESPNAPTVPSLPTLPLSVPVHISL
jgi:hypothetical protein